MCMVILLMVVYRNANRLIQNLHQEFASNEGPQKELAAHHRFKSAYLAKR